MNKRGLTSFFSVAGFLIMTITGLVLYFVPEGRISYWVDWKFLGLTKVDWGNIHIISSILWVVAACFHLYFNWNVLMSYIYRKLRGGWHLKREMGLAAVLSIVVIAGSIYLFPPFNYVIDFSKYLKDSWVAGPEYEPPIGHAEQLSLKSFTNRLNIDLNSALATMKDKGIQVDDPDQAIETIARRNNTSPMNMYILIKPLEKKPELAKGEAWTHERVEDELTGTGLGRKDLVQLTTDLGLNLDDVKTRMAQKGIELKDGETMKEASERLGVNPMDIAKAVLIEDYTIQ